MIDTGSIAETRKLCDDARDRGEIVGFVPTMGALHEGHRSLIRRARAESGFVVVSIFVNPTQFGPHEDLEAYPRPLEADLEACADESVDLVFHPDADEMYPDGAKTTVHVAGLTEPMEGKFRPGHFDGVTTVCAKLFGIVGPCRAYFGEKDVQQLRVVARMTRDLDMPVEIVACPTIRDADGLAISSRNVYLDDLERTRALSLYRALTAIRSSREPSARARIDHGIALSEADAIDYVEIVDPETLEPLDRIEGKALVCGAIRIGKTRLIDNVTIGEA